MTNKEAIDVLEHNFPSSCYTDLCEAVNVAIEALQRETSDDAISRRAAIEGLKGYIDDTGIFNQDKWFVHGIKTAITHLKSLPSVQPEIVHCKDCKHHWTHSCMDAFPREICDLDQTFYDSNFDYCSLAERRTDDEQ